MANLLEFKNVTKVYSSGLLTKTSTTALNNVSFELTENEPTIMTVAGESGSGKTTLAMLLLGFIPATGGQILYKGQDISQLKGDERMTFRREVQAVFQDPFAVFNPFYPVDHLLSVPIKQFNMASSKSEARDKMVEALTAVGLHPQDVLGRFPHQLSGLSVQAVQVAIYRSTIQCITPNQWRASHLVICLESPDFFCIVCVNAVYITIDSAGIKQILHYTGTRD